MHGKPQVKWKLHTYASQEAQKSYRYAFPFQTDRYGNDSRVALRKVSSTKSVIIIICNPASVVVATPSWSANHLWFPDMAVVTISAFTLT